MHDHPAAHSMDSTWFAVDAAGHVAFFDTGEGGAVPGEGFPAGGEAGGHDPLELDDLLRVLLDRRRATLPALAELLPDDEALDTLMDRVDWQEGPELARDRRHDRGHRRPRGAGRAGGAEPGVGGGPHPHGRAP